MSFFPRDLTAPAPVSGPGIPWEETDCLLCGRRHWSLLVEAPDVGTGSKGLWFAVVQCQDCGLCFTNPRPQAQAMARFYPPEYQPHQSRPRARENLRSGASSFSLLPSSWKWRLPGRERGLLDWPGPGRLLDFGCGAGRFLERMHLQGWQVTGLDVFPAAVQRVRADLHLPALAGSLPHPELAPGSFDVITMRNSLEHVHQPLEVLCAAHRLLTPQGKLVVTVPNIDSLPFRWFGRAWVGLDLPRHLTHFSPATLHRMLQRAGFEVRSLQMIRHRNWLRSSADLSSRIPRRPYWHHWLKHKSLAGLATWYSYLTRQTDCLLAIAQRGADWP